MPFEDWRADAENNSYLIYSVWRLDGPSAAVAKRLVDHAIHAEANGLTGRGCFDRNRGGLSYTHPDTVEVEADWNIYRAAEMAREKGWEVEEDSNDEEFGTAPAPLRCENDALFAGQYRLNSYADAFGWVPGSIGFHLDSGAALDPRGGPTWSANALLRGITVTGGGVAEPFVPGQLRVDGFYHDLFSGARVGDADPQPAPTPTATPTPSPTPTPGAARAVSFDGLAQGARASFPALPAFTARGAYRVEGRLRSLRNNHSSMQMLFEVFNPTTEQEHGKLIFTGSNFLGFSLRGASPLITDGKTDLLFRAQFDPARSRVTLETWNLDGSGYRSANDALGNVSDLNLSGSRLTLAGTAYSLFHARVKMDWMRMLDGAVALGTGPPGAAVPAGAVQLWRYEFENDGADSGPSGMSLTLFNSPLFENTP